MSVEIRKARPSDAPRLGELAGVLVRMHHATDPRRFMLVDGVERGYGSWLGRELAREGALVLVAEEGGVIVGYTYSTLEGRDWNLLLDEHAELHDILVAEDARRRGVGKALLEATLAELDARGVERVVLGTMVQNEAAQALFRSSGFRPTMIEMTRG